MQLERHRTRSFQEMEEWGDRIGAYDLIVALSPAASARRQEYTRYHAIDVDTGRSSIPPASARRAKPNSPPTAGPATRSKTRIRNRFGPPDEDDPRLLRG